MPPVPPRQARSRETLERVLATAEALFVEVGQVGFTIPEVSRRAEVSIGTIYRRFASKEDLLHAVVARAHADLSESAFEDWDKTDWGAIDREAMIGRLVRDLSRIWRERIPLMRALMAGRLQAPNTTLFERGVRSATDQEAAFARVVRTHLAEIRQPEPDLAIDFAHRLIIGTCARWSAEAIETRAPRPMSWDEMLDHLTDAVIAYLFAAPV